MEGFALPPVRVPPPTREPLWTLFSRDLFYFEYLLGLDHRLGPSGLLEKYPSGQIYSF